MLKTSIYLLIFLTLTILFYCGGRTGSATPALEIPKPLQDDKLNYKRSGSNLMEDLYGELVDKSSELKELENNLDGFKTTLEELKDKFNNYDSKSNNYYTSSEHRANSIADSLLRKKMTAILASSKNKYSNKKEELNSLLKVIAENGGTLNDHHIALKILLTLPIIERYQTENLLNKKDFKELIKEQEKLIEETGRLTPK